MSEWGEEYDSLFLIIYPGTLLNMLFDTQFEVMDPEKGRGQTTEGIWCAVDDKKQILILDFEGVDAKIRGDNRLVNHLSHLEDRNYSLAF